MTLMLSKLLRSSRFGNRHRRTFGLPTLVLAGAFCLSIAGPALADFESAIADFGSAIAAFEDGAYQAAQREFEALAAAGDERAEPYLERIRQRLSDEQPTDGSFTSTISETLTSIFSGPDRPSDESQSESAARDSGSVFAGPSTESAARDKPADWKPWSPFDQSTPTASPPPAPQSDVVTPERRSIWSAIFHLPGDATVIGLQYAAQFLEADNLSRDLQFLRRHSDKIALSILAGFWWLVIIKGMVGLIAAIMRFMKTAITISEQKRYG